ncbi:WD40 repeat-like protein, partial [Suillus brevipes Sb2]
DSTVRLWDVATGQPVGEPLRGHTYSVYSVSFSPDGTRIVSGSWDMTVRLWDAATGQPVGEPLRGHTDSVNSVSFSPDGTRIVSGSSDKTVRLWDAVTRHPSQQCAVSHSSAFSDEHCTIEATTTITSNTWINHLISFSGWMVGPKDRLLFWVPPASRHRFYYNPETVLVIPRGCPELDLSRMAHGQHWQQCREE